MQISGYIEKQKYPHAVGHALSSTDPHVGRKRCTVGISGSLWVFALHCGYSVADY
jgi:hypothetical protein